MVIKVLQKIFNMGMSHIKWKLWSWGFQWCKNNAKFWPYMVPIWRKKRKVCIQEFLILPTFLMDKSKDIGQFQASFSTFLVGNTSRLYDFSHFECFWDVSMIFKKNTVEHCLQKCLLYSPETFSHTFTVHFQ